MRNTKLCDNPKWGVEELKPCPFCGDDVIALDLKGMTFVAECLGCHAAIENSHTACLRANWNQRAPTTAPGRGPTGAPPMSGPPMHHCVKHGIWLNPATMEHECWWAGELRWTMTAQAMLEHRQRQQRRAPAGSGHPTEEP